jgi:hypothetical protein
MQELEQSPYWGVLGRHITYVPQYGSYQVVHIAIAITITVAITITIAIISTTADLAGISGASA